MKKIVVMLLVLVVLIGGFFVFENFNKKEVVPCGYGSTSKWRVDCACSGKKSSEIGMGATSYFCDGSCSDCKCYKQDLAKKTEEQVSCAEAEGIQWSFPVME